jgi:hypothetical protein
VWLSTSSELYQFPWQLWCLYICAFCDPCGQTKCHCCVVPCCD